MNADEISKRLRKIDSEAAGNQLSNECGKRIEEIRARIAQIALGHPTFGNPPERDKAIRNGQAAVQALDDEIKQLNAEVDYCSSLLGECIAAGQKAELERRRQAMHKAVRALPDAEREVAKCRDALLSAMARHRSLIEDLGAFADCNEQRPISDGEIADTLRLRDTLWAIPDLAVIAPNESDPISLSLYMASHSGGLGTHVRRRFDNASMFSEEPVVRRVAG